jgi:hypothetical protein
VIFCGPLAGVGFVLVFGFGLAIFWVAKSSCVGKYLKTILGLSE